MTEPVLSDRALSRATLARQLLLERSSMPPIEAIEHLVGLQAQNPLDPYLSLWSRLDDFDPAVVGGLVEDRTLVRIVVMRGTIHLVTADDALQLRPVMQPVLDAELSRHSEYKSHVADLDMTPVLEFAHPLLAETPMSGRLLRTALAERFPDEHAAALAYACRCLIPLVQVPPRGVWGKTLQVTSAPLDAWVGRPIATDASLDDAVLRYLAAFGPATVADVSSWSRLTGMREVVERIRPALRSFRNEKGQELFDLPDAPRPDPDVDAPVRFLPEYDNVLLSHADRSRFGSSEQQAFAKALGDFKGSVLADGQVKAIWRFDLDRRTKHAVLTVEHLKIPKRSRTAMEREADRVAAFWIPRAESRDVRLLELTG
jgi:hypothetical protein